MLQNIPVSEIMSSNVITIDMHQSLEEALNTFKSHRIRHLPVIAYDSLVGLLSLADIERLNKTSAHTGDSSLFDVLGIEQVMLMQPKTVKMGQSVLDVANILAKEEVYAIPVTENGNLVGIVTTTDLIKFMLEKFGLPKRQ